MSVDILRWMGHMSVDQPGRMQKLIAAARAGNGEPLARYIEDDLPPPPCWDLFPDELRAFLAELVRRGVKPGHHPKSYAAFRRNRQIAWSVAKRRLAGKRPEEAVTDVVDSKEFGIVNRRTVQRAWQRNPDLHKPEFVKLALALIEIGYSPRIIDLD